MNPNRCFYSPLLNHFGISPGRNRMRCTEYMHSPNSQVDHSCCYSFIFKQYSSVAFILYNNVIGIANFIFLPALRSFAKIPQQLDPRVNIIYWGRKGYCYQALPSYCWSMHQKHNIKSNKDFDSPPLLFSVYHAKGNKKRRKWTEDRD
jgi:hypothetical protein